MKTFVVPVSWFNRGVMLSGFREEDHPRDKNGLFIDKDEIAAAAGGDEDAANALREKVRPADAAKLERAIGTKGNADAEHAGAVLEKHTGQQWNGRKPLSSHMASYDAHIKDQLGDDADVSSIKHYALNVAAQIARQNPDIKGKINHENLLDIAVNRAIEHESKVRKTEEFGDKYFDEDSADGRVDSFLENFVLNSGDDALNFDSLHPDTQAAILEDVATWGADPQQKANTFANLLDQYGLDSDEPLVGAFRSALATNAPTPESFDPDEIENYATIDLSKLDSAQRENAEAFMTATGAVPFAMAPGVYVVPWNGERPVDELLATDELRGEDVAHVADAAGRAAMFERIKSPRTIGESQSPMSSRNTGTVSGNMQGGGEVETDWNPQNADVYRRLNRDWYMVRLGRTSPEASEAGDRYKFVKAADAPVQVRLPDQYWKDDAPAEHDDIDHDAAQRIGQKESGESAGERKSFDEAMSEYKQRKSVAAPLKKRHDAIVKRSEEADRLNDEISELYEEHSRHSSSGLEDVGEEHNGAADELIEAMNALHEDSANTPDVPEWGLKLGAPVEYEKQGKKTTGRVKRFETREDHIDHLTSAVSDFDDEADSLTNEIDDTETGFDTWRDDVASHWRSVAEAAEKVIRTGSGNDNADVKSNVRAAARVLTAARRHLRNHAKHSAAK